MSESSAPAAGRIPVTVVFGGGRSGKSRLIAQLRARRPAGERWALLSNSAGSAGSATRLERGQMDAAPAEEHFAVAGGCACCIAGPAFRTTLVRILRAGPWKHLHIEVDPAGHPHRLVDQLRTPPFDRYLAVSGLLLTLGEDDEGLYRGDDLLSAGGRLGLATDFLLQSSQPSPPDTGFVRRLQTAPPWPRLERTAAGRREREAPGRSGGSGQPDSPSFARLPDLPGWRVFSAVAPDLWLAGFGSLRQWPAEAVAARRPVKDMLGTLAATRGVAGFQALIRTPRAWYRWGFGRGQGAGPLTFDDGPHVVESETAWRFDNRLCLWLEPGPVHREVPELASCLAALDQAMRGWMTVPVETASHAMGATRLA